MSRSPLLSAVLLLAAAILLAAIVWASGAASLSESFSKMIADPWGVVTLIDLYGGLLAAAAIILLVEPDRRIAIPAAIALPFLGNLVLLVWLAVRGLPRLVRNG